MGETERHERPTGLFRAAVLLTAASVVNLLVNLLIQVRIAAYFGAGADMDAYKAAMTIPQWLQLFLGVALTFVLVPFFVRTFRRDESAGWRAASAIVNFTLLGAAGSVAVAALAGRGLIRAVAPGLAETGALLAGRLFLLTLPGGVLLLLQAMLINVSHARFRFLRPALATFLNGAVTLAVLVGLVHRLGISALPVANLVGTALAVLVLVGVLLRAGRYRPSLAVRGTGLGQAALAGLPLILTAPIYQSEGLVATRVASSMGEGVLSYLRYATVLVTALFTATATGLAAAVFPFLSRAADETDRRMLKERLVQGVGGMLYVALPVAALAVALAHPGIRALFQRGAFTPEHVAPVANLLLFYLLAYVAMCLGTVTSNAIFALRRTLEASGLFVLAFGVYAAAMVVLPRLTRPAYYGIALAASLHYVVRLALSWGLLRRRLGKLEGGDLVRSGLKYLLSAVIAGGAAYGLTAAIPGGRTLGGVVLAGLAGAGVYLALTLAVLRSPLADLARQRLAARLRRTHKNNSPQRHRGHGERTEKNEQKMHSG